ncbi:hypothetical protein VTK26DRAFT_2854 [Humicola hyalothermophila]
MVRLSFVTALAWAACLAPASAGPAPNVGVRVRNIPGADESFTLAEIGRRIRNLVLQKRKTVFHNSTTIEKAWENAPIFSREFVPPEEEEESGEDKGADKSNPDNTDGTDRNGPGNTKGTDKSSPDNSGAGSSSADKSSPDKSNTDKSGPGDEDGNNKNKPSVDVHAGVEITCVDCYLIAGATAKMTVNGTFDLGNALKNVTEQIGEELKNMTETLADSIGDYTGHILKEAITFDLDAEDFSFDDYHVDMDFDIDLPPLPEVELLFQIDHLDLYMLIEASITAGSTISIPLFISQTPLGFSAGDDLLMGLVATVDLILSVEGMLNLRTGFHLQTDGPVGFKLSLFSHDVADMIFNGGRFEFLPVTIHYAEVALKAVLRVGLTAGFSINTPGPFDMIGAGVEVGVFAHVAEFLTNATAGDVVEKANDDCKLRVVQEYTFGVGAAAGATINFLDNTWGPQPSTTIPIWYTTIADICAIDGGATPTTTAAPRYLLARQDENVPLTTATVTTTARYTAVDCEDPALVGNCPVRLQRTEVKKTTRTAVVTVPEGVEPTFPESTASSVTRTVPFGKDVNRIAATSGEPTSYTPPPPPPTTSARPDEEEEEDDDDEDKDFSEKVDEIINGETGGVSNKVIIGVSVGVGVPVLIGIIAAIVWYMRRKRYTPVPKADLSEPMGYQGPYDSPPSGSAEGEGLMAKKTPAVAVGEVQENK